MNQPLINAEFVRQQGRVIELLDELNENTIEAPRRTELEDLDELLVKVVQVITAGIPVQGPSVAIPRGYTTLVRQRAHAGAPIGYVAGSRNAVANNRERIELQDGENVTVRVSNLKNIWVDADSIPALGFFIELIVTQ